MLTGLRFPLDSLMRRDSVYSEEIQDHRSARRVLTLQIKTVSGARLLKPRHSLPANSIKNIKERSGKGVLLWFCLVLFIASQGIFSPLY